MHYPLLKIIARPLRFILQMGVMLGLLAPLHVKTSHAGTLVDAVMNGNKSEARRLIKSGVFLDETNRKDETPLILAAKTDQFVIAEMLLDAGADIFKASKFGWTVGYAAETSRLSRGEEYEARLRVIEKLKARNYPFPAIHPAAMQDKIANGQWPPAN